MNNELLRLNLQYFAEESEEVTNDEPDQTTEEVSQPKTVTMTQDELNALIGKEKGRVKSKYADYGDIKAKLAEYETAEQERKTAEMTELEKLQAQLQTKETAEQALMKKLEEAESLNKAEKIRNEFIKAATGENIAYIDDAFALADLSQVKVEEGKVVGMTDAVKSLVENKPFLVAKKQPKQIGESTNGNVDRADKTAEQLLREAAEKARISGRNEDRAAYAKLKRELNL
ncbi:phage scaffolding protein [Bacillus sp. JJ722]|uniref:phage scaffolding protein n=1 Tax=Bacillus sp. JJ722 TaxID=3122973 RepID=UPI002FFEA336